MEINVRYEVTDTKLQLFFIIIEWHIAHAWQKMKILINQALRSL